MNRFFRYGLACAALAGCFSLTACDNAEDAPPSWDEARIQTRGVDEIVLGMTYSGVKEKLGNPDSESYASSRGREYIGYIYSYGKYKGLHFYFKADSGIPKSDLNLHSIHIRSGYVGKGFGGLGIGSNIDGIVDFLGNPDLSHGIVDSLYSYCTNEGMITFSFPPPNHNNLEAIFIEHHDLITYEGSNCAEW